MEESLFLEADSRSVGQEISRCLCNLKIHYRLYKISTRCPEPVESSSIPNAAKIHLSHPIYASVSKVVSSDFRTKVLYKFFSCIRTTCLSHTISLYFVTLIVRDEECKIWSSPENCVSVPCLALHSFKKQLPVCILPGETPTAEGQDVITC